ncbi:competence protein ComK [Caldibacillus lycopersici]|uniref:Competence protein ComK n=1 Tax=Perspicuibacillus lycopersici TaxID=1325689 RepID=A0AAE3IRD7_9BACI|nr:competence protein ComK [Perspicuibacillus lycopersici]MCU9613042.1 competence protein ComK [Perspicuibacillus lycopersici]
MIEKMYLINYNTSAIISKFDEYGNEYSMILEGKQVFIFKQKPLDIINHSFHKVGNNLDGAIEAARVILNRKYKVPAAFVPHIEIILIPCDTLDKRGSVWLVKSHIEDFQEIGKKKTRVYTKHGQSISIAMSKRSLQAKIAQASHLYVELSKNIQAIRNTLQPVQVSYILENPIEYLPKQ